MQDCVAKKLISRQSGTWPSRGTSVYEESYPFFVELYGVENQKKKEEKKELLRER